MKHDVTVYEKLTGRCNLCFQAPSSAANLRIELSYLLITASPAACPSRCCNSLDPCLLIEPVRLFSLQILSKLSKARMKRFTMRRMQKTYKIRFGEIFRYLAIRAILRRKMRKNTYGKVSRVERLIVRFRITTLLVAFSIFQTNCVRAEPAICNSFFETPSSNRDSLFAQYDLDTQLQIQRCGIDHEPPRDYSSALAYRGPEVIPDLLERLDQQRSIQNYYEREKRDFVIIEAFEGLALAGHLVGRQDILPPLSATVNGMKDDWIKRKADDSLEWIKHGVDGSFPKP